MRLPYRHRGKLSYRHISNRDQSRSLAQESFANGRDPYQRQRPICHCIKCRKFVYYGKALRPVDAGTARGQSDLPAPACHKSCSYAADVSHTVPPHVGLVCCRLHHSPRMRILLVRPSIYNNITGTCIIRSCLQRRGLQPPRIHPSRARAASSRAPSAQRLPRPGEGRLCPPCAPQASAARAAASPGLQCRDPCGHQRGAVAGGTAATRIARAGGALRVAAGGCMKESRFHPSQNITLQSHS